MLAVAKGHVSQELVAHMQNVADERRAKDAAKQKKQGDVTARLTAVEVVTDHEKIGRMKLDALEDQLEIHRRNGDKEIPLKSHLKNKAAKLAALLAALERLEVQPLSDTTQGREPRYIL